MVQPDWNEQFVSTTSSLIFATDNWLIQLCTIYQSS